MPAAQGGPTGSVRLLLTRNPARCLNCPGGRVRGVSFERIPQPRQNVRVPSLLLLQFREPPQTLSQPRYDLQGKNLDTTKLIPKTTQKEPKKTHSFDIPTIQTGYRTHEAIANNFLLTQQHIGRLNSRLAV